MSERNVELIRRGQDAFNRGDLDPVKDDFSADVDWGAVGAFPGLASSYRGHDGIDRWMQTVRAAFASFSASLERVVRDDGDVVVVVEHLRGRGRESRAEVEMRIHSVYWFEDGRIVRRRAFTGGEEEALAAAAREPGEGPPAP